ncbi:hypothetical protein FQN57_006973 [Myotisia sp. PD_48]|nr:hypothetical protein FQN57_006973 [Myotisia sp. PD_48]
MPPKGTGPQQAAEPKKGKKSTRKGNGESNVPVAPTSTKPTPRKRRVASTKEKDGEGTTENAPRGKRQRRDSDNTAAVNTSGSPGTLIPEVGAGRVHLELQTNQTEMWTGPPIHNPEIYEQIRQAGEAGVYIGPGAGTVVRYSQPTSCPSTAVLEEHVEEALVGNVMQPQPPFTGSESSEIKVGVKGMSSDLVEGQVGEAVVTATQEINQSIPTIEVSQSRDQSHGKESASRKQDAPSPPAEASRPRSPTIQKDSTTIEEENDARRSQPSQGQEVKPNKEVEVISISSDDITNPAHLLDGNLGKERPILPEEQPETPIPNEKEPGDRPKGKEKRVPYNVWFQERETQRVRQNFKPFGAAQLLDAFPLPSQPNRRMRTWTAPRIDNMGNSLLTLIAVLPPYPQLSRPFRRAEFFPQPRRSMSPPAVKRRTEKAIMSDRLEAVVKSIKEEVEAAHASTGKQKQQESETEPEAGKRPRRQAAITGRLRLVESMTPAPRTTRRSTSRSVSVAPSLGSEQAPTTVNAMCIPPTILEEEEEGDEEEEVEEEGDEEEEEQAKPAQKRGGKASRGRGAKGRQTRQAPKVSKSRSKSSGRKGTNRGKEKN